MLRLGGLGDAAMLPKKGAKVFRGGYGGERAAPSCCVVKAAGGGWDLRLRWGCGGRCHAAGRSLWGAIMLQEGGCQKGQRRVGEEGVNVMLRVGVMESAVTLREGGRGVKVSGGGGGTPSCCGWGGWVNAAMLPEGRGDNI